MDHYVGADCTMTADALRVNRRWGPARIGHRLGIHPSTVHRVLSRYGLTGLTWQDRATGRVIRRYERSAPGELVKFESSVDYNRYIVQTLTHPDGTSVVYHPGTKHSSINVHSACSSDPGMDMRSQ